MPLLRLAPMLALIFLLLAGCSPAVAGGAMASTPTPSTGDLAGQVTEHDHVYPPRDLSNGRFVSIGQDGEVHLVDIASGERKRLTDDGQRKQEAVISGGYVAWISGGHIYLLDLSTDEAKRITGTPAQRNDLAMSGHRLVWSDNRNEANGHYTHSDIYAYDITTGEEQPIAVAEGSQRGPSIHGDLVVWKDNRHSPTRDTALAGCGNCPENRFDIYLYDFRTSQETVIAEGDFLKGHPSIYENYVVWEDFRDGWEAGIYLLDLSTGMERRLSTGPGVPTSPALSGNHVIWHMRSACDVFPQPEKTGVFLHDLTSGTTRQISDYVEPRAIIGEGVVMVSEGCWGVSRVFSVSLD